jgi:hypothetical protein
MTPAGAAPGAAISSTTRASKWAAPNIASTPIKRVLAVSRKDQAQADRLDQGLKYAADLLKAEGGDPKVVMAAIILHEVTVDQAREILADMETEPEMAAAIMAVLSGSPDADPANRDLVQDVLALLQTGGAPAHFATKTAARLAATQ